MKNILSLTRWREHILFTTPLTILGGIIATRSGAELDIRLVWVVLANVAVVSYAFAINDIEDSEDDARDPAKQTRNPISSGRISRKDATTIVRALAVVTLVLYAFTTKLTFGIGLATLLLSHLYSWRAVRLKAYPVTDLLSHSLMLSGLLVLSGYSVYSASFRQIWIIVASAVGFSIYGQLYNQIRDYKVDAQARLKNTTLLLGRRRARLLMNASIILSIITLLSAVYFKMFPLYLLVPIIVSTPLVFSFKVKNDSSGIAAIDLTGKLQTQVLIIFNIVILFWLGAIFFGALI
jgi:4-hydroxybenzoate polyprenyltransferase